MPGVLELSAIMSLENLHLLPGKPQIIVLNTEIFWDPMMQPTIFNPSFVHHPSFVHNKYPTHFCVAFSHIWKMGPSVSIDDICNSFEVEKDMLKVVSKCLSVTLAELCQVRDDSEMVSSSACGNCIQVCPGTTSSCTSWTSDSDWEHRRAILGMCQSQESAFQVSLAWAITSILPCSLISSLLQI
jgi:hypothetical protein